MPRPIIAPTDKSRHFAAGAVAILATTAILFFLAAGGSHRFDTVRSPAGNEAVDFYTANRWQSWQHGSADLPGYVRLRRIADGADLGGSAAVELAGEDRVFWLRDTVQVGTSLAYDRATRRWRTLQGR